MDIDDLVDLSGIDQCEEWQPIGELRWSIGEKSHYRRLEQRWRVITYHAGKAVGSRFEWREVPERIVPEGKDANA